MEVTPFYGRLSQVLQQLMKQLLPVHFLATSLVTLRSSPEDNICSFLS